MIEPTCTGPNQTQPEPTASFEAGLEDQSSLPATLVSERETATHETNSSLSALSSPTDLGTGSGGGVCVHTGPAGETEVMWPEQHWA